MRDLEPGAAGGADAGALVVGDGGGRSAAPPRRSRWSSIFVSPAPRSTSPASGSIGDIVMFMSFAGMLIGQPGADRQLPPTRCSCNRRSCADFFTVLDTVPQVADKPGARDPGHLAGRVAFERRRLRLPGPRRQGADPGGGRSRRSSPSPARRSRWSARPARASRPRSPCCTAPSTRLRGRVTIDGVDIADMPLDGLRRNIGVVFQEPMLFARSIEENLRIGKPDATIRRDRDARSTGRRPRISSPASRRASKPRSASAAARSPAANASAWPSPAPC